MSELEYPQDLRYTAEHEWVRVGSDGVARVGITAFAQDALGDVVYVSLPAVGDPVAAGDSCGEVESTKSVSDIFAPLSGEIVAVNATLDSAPELVNTDPYGEGWMYDVKLTDAGAAESLLDLEGYRALLG
ncbi:MAG TPA: glycine cleavage system protein GcvH [Dermatophilaceae bacterium]|jgi:glycine cleavage system H protein|nr:glycine cleavage system protein GcvH [Dermatophilaceae bacterium]